MIFYEEKYKCVAMTAERNLLLRDRLANGMALYSVIIVGTLKIFEVLILRKSEVVSVLVLIVPILLNYIYYSISRKAAYVWVRSFYYAVILLLLMAYSVSFQYYLGPYGPNVFYDNVYGAVVVNSAVLFLWFLLGMSFAQSYDIDFLWGRGVAVFGLLFLFYMIYSASGDYYYLIAYDEIRQNSSFDHASHLMIEDYAVLVIYYAIIVARDYRVYVFIVGVVALFAFQGRSSFYLYILSFVLSLYLRRGVLSYGRYRHVGLYLFFGVVLLFCAMGGFMDEMGTVGAEIKKIFFSEGLLADGSAMGRLEQFYVGLKYLPSQFFVGDVLTIYSHYNSFGDFIHNMLSAWQIYGFHFFIFMIFLSLKSLRNYLVWIKSGDKNVYSEYMGLILVFSLLGIIVSKGCYYVLFWYSVGYWVALGDVIVRPANITRDLI